MNEGRTIHRAILSRLMIARYGWLVAVALAMAAGCTNQNPLVLQNQMQQLQQQQIAMRQEGEEIRRRADQLDQDNQQLETLLAQAEQRARLLEDRLTATKDQLNSTTTQLAEARNANVELEKQAQTLTVSSKQKNKRATITANNTLARSLPNIEIPGVEVRVDGDVVRIELPADRLFQPKSAQLTSEGVRLVEIAADEIYRAYPRQIVGIEGHTDPDPIRSPTFASNHHLSTAQATAVFDHLAGRSKLRAERMFVVGHGANHPVVSNATQAGKARNRRVELVVYPETTPQ